MANMTKIVGVIHKQCFVFWIKKVYECSDKQIFYRITIECIIFSMNSCQFTYNYCSIIKHGNDIW